MRIIFAYCGYPGSPTLKSFFAGEKVTTKGKRCDSDLDDSFDSDDCDDLCTTAVVYGPSGSGKTSLVWFLKKYASTSIIPWKC